MSTPSAAAGSLKRDLITAAAPADDRDIDVVLVTGAGASCPFGVNGKPLPLMGDWADHLVRKLAERIGYREMTGLRRGMSGEEFESQLGRFLQDAQAFRRINPLLEPSLLLPNVVDNPQAMNAPAMSRWHQQASSHLDQINELLYESLYEMFADPSVDSGAAAKAYQELFGALGIGPASKFVYATTNYDTIGERAIRDSGGMPDWGAPPSPAPAGEASVRVAGLLDGLPRYTPVLHLHGRVGWFLRDGSVREINTPNYQAGFGGPLVMLPDPDKVYDQDDTIIALWREFARALARAKRVLILGHSLNDQFLLRALVQNVEPLDRIAVTVLSNPHEANQPDNSATPVIAKIRQTLGNAAMIPMRFGANTDYREGISTWTDKLGTGDLL